LTFFGKFLSILRLLIIGTPPRPFSTGALAVSFKDLNGGRGGLENFSLFLSVFEIYLPTSSILQSGDNWTTDKV
jgi:hypothetical protein